ncbi:MAG: hypothetical protein WAK98_03535 [Gemmobacter sp.]
MTLTENVSDEMLMALADGELDAGLAAQLRDRIAADPALAARHALFVETRAALQAAFPAEPVPERLRDAVMQAAPEANVLPFAPRHTSAPAWGMAIAASLLLAVGGFWLGRLATPAGQIATPEAAALQLASVPTGGVTTLPDGRTARVLGSYETDIGLCRMIGLPTDRALVCKRDEGQGWITLASVAVAGEDGWVPANDMGTMLIDGLLDELGAGPALPPEIEATLLAP